MTKLNRTESSSNSKPRPSKPEISITWAHPRLTTINALNKQETQYREAQATVFETHL